MLRSELRGNLISVSGDQLTEGKHDVLPLRERGVTPSLVCLLGGLDGEVDVIGRCV